MSAAAVVRVGVGCLVLSKNHPGCILLGERQGSHGAGKLAAPGGHLEVGEQWSDCALREVEEETNVKIENIKLVHVTNDVNIDGNPLKHYITLFICAHITEDSPELINKEPHKCVSWSWVSWRDLCRMQREQPERLFEPMRNLILGLNHQEEAEFLTNI